MPTSRAGTAALCLVDLQTGIGHCFCSMSCLHIWAKFKNYDFGIEQVGWSRQEECIYCYKCGDLARESPECDTHEGQCPRNLFEHTYAAHAVGRVVYEKLGRPLEDNDIEAIRKAVKLRTGEESTLDLALNALALIDEVQWDRD